MVRRQGMILSLGNGTASLRRRGTVLVWALCFVMAAACVSVAEAEAQTSSLGARQRKADEQSPPVVTLPERAAPKVHPVVARHSWTAIEPPKPKTFKVNDLITIIIREQRRFKADAELKNERSFELKSDVTAFLDFVDGGVGTARFKRGRPNVDYTLESTSDNSGEMKRTDRLTTRITVKIIDVKPNGTLVLEGKARIQHEKEISDITITGICRKEDVSADNTVLSTQIADKHVVIDNKGAVRDGAKRGWITRLLDFVNPF